MELPVFVDLTQARLLGYVVLAMMLGALIGAERQSAEKPAGLRTHMLVAGASALFALLGGIAIHHFGANTPAGLVRADPIRIIQSIVIGVSFLGAGTIIRRDPARRIEGLTTAASILFASAVGICVAFSQFVLAVGATILVLLTLRTVGNIQKKHNS